MSKAWDLIEQMKPGDSHEFPFEVVLDFLPINDLTANGAGFAYSDITGGDWHFFSIVEVDTDRRIARIERTK